MCAISVSSVVLQLYRPDFMFRGEEKEKRSDQRRRGKQLFVSVSLSNIHLR